MYTGKNHRLASPFSHFCKRITSACFFVNKRTKNKLPFARWVNGLRKSAWSSVFRFLFKTTVYIQYIYIFGKRNFRLFAAVVWKFSFICCRRKMETANFRLSAANRNGKRKFVVLGRQTIAVIDDFCFSKRARPQERTWRKGKSKQTDSFQSLYWLYSTGWFVLLLPRLHKLQYCTVRVHWNQLP